VVKVAPRNAALPPYSPSAPSRSLPVDVQWPPLREGVTCEEAIRQARARSFVPPPLPTVRPRYETWRGQLEDVMRWAVNPLWRWRR
jgi:hypothetical protein